MCQKYKMFALIVFLWISDLSTKNEKPSKKKTIRFRRDTKNFMNIEFFGEIKKSNEHQMSKMFSQILDQQKKSGNLKINSLEQHRKKPFFFWVGKIWGENLFCSKGHPFVIMVILPLRPISGGSLVLKHSHLGNGVCRKMFFPNQGMMPEVII